MRLKSVSLYFFSIVMFLSLSAGQALSNSKLMMFAAYGGKDEIFSEFKKDTGITVEYLSMSSGEVLSRVRAEKGKPIGDVWFGGGVDSFIAAKADGLLEQYVPKGAQAIPAQFRDKDGYWTGVSLVTVSFIVNREVCREKGVEIPQTWQDLLNPAFKGEILMSNPSISGTAYTILTGILQTMGVEKGWEYLDKLNTQIPYYAKRGSEPPKKAALGEVMVGLSPGTYEELAKEGYPVTGVLPKDGTPWWPAPAAIFKGTKRLKEAKAFMDWCTSRKGQEILKKYCVRVPARSDVNPPEILSDIKEANLMTIDFEKAGKERDALVKKWQERHAK